MTLKMLNSLQYHSNGWSLSNFVRSAGNGQSGLTSFRATLGAFTDVVFSYVAETHVVFGWCFRRNQLADDRLFQVNLAGTQLLRVTTSASGQLVVATGTGNGTEQGRTAPGLINLDVECYIEIRVKHSATIGEVEIRVNGNPTAALSLTSLNTGTSSDQIGLSGGGGGIRDHSAPYFLVVDGTPPNTFLGHIRYGALDPTGNGNSSVLVGSDGNSVDNYLLVDDGAGGITNDADTTYVESATTGQKDTYGMENIPTTPLTIVAIATVLIAKKTDAGTRSVKAVIRRSGTDYDGVAAFLGTSYDAHVALVLTDPSTAAAWTEAGINAMEVGVKVDT